MPQPIQIGTNRTQWMVALGIVTLCTCCLALPIVVPIGIIAYILTKPR